MKGKSTFRALRPTHKKSFFECPPRQWKALFFACNQALEPQEQYPRYANRPLCDHSHSPSDRPSLEPIRRSLSFHGNRGNHSVTSRESQFSRPAHQRRYTRAVATFGTRPKTSAQNVSPGINRTWHAPQQTHSAETRMAASNANPTWPLAGPRQDRSRALDPFHCRKIGTFWRCDLPPTGDISRYRPSPSKRHWLYAEQYR